MLSPSKPNPFVMACAVSRFLLQAVSSMHERGVAWRDVKSENIICRQEPGAGDPQLVTLDFGGAVAWNVEQGVLHACYFLLICRCNGGKGSLCSFQQKPIRLASLHLQQQSRTTLWQSRSGLLVQV